MAACACGGSVLHHAALNALCGMCACRRGAPGNVHQGPEGALRTSIHQLAHLCSSALTLIQLCPPPTGEVHLETCIKDLKERFARCELVVSPPLVAFRQAH